LTFLVDVCIPTYNEKGFIERTLSNLAAQELYKKDKVHIIIGDYKDELNMDDDYLANVCKRLKHVTYIPVFIKGIANARNIIISESSKTNIIMNFDADSVFNRADAIERMIHPILHKEVKLTNCETVLYDFNADRMIPKTPQAPNFYEFASNIGTSLEKYLFARGPGLTVDKDAYLAVGGFRDVSVAEDYLLSMDICLEYSIRAKRFIPEVKVLTSNRRAKSFADVGFGVFDYVNHNVR
jgi:glycosyltransferase involved in cell wall biosynthesis